MNKIDAALVAEAKELVTNILTRELSENCLFHTINHTLEVLNNAEIIGTYSKLNQNDMNVLRVSALFHDVGYVDIYDDHEIISAARATAFLRNRNVDEGSIKQVEAAILSTKMPQSPKDKISEILCDSDLMYLTFDDYFDQIDLMRIEWEKVGKARLNSNEFHVQSLDFFKQHKYHSDYGRKVLQPIKEKNEFLIRKRVVVD